MNPVPPKVGNPVWFYPTERDNIESSTEGYCAAIITQVWTVYRVNVVAFDKSGWPYSIVNLQLVQPGSTPPTVGHYCVWPA